jgi:hypothetical protein
MSASGAMAGECSRGVVARSVSLVMDAMRAEDMIFHRTRFSQFGGRAIRGWARKNVYLDEFDEGFTVPELC